MNLDKYSKYQQENQLIHNSVRQYTKKVNVTFKIV